MDATIRHLHEVRDDAGRSLAGAFAVIVHTDDEKIRRRVYMTLNGAQRAAERAQARGNRAEVVLCELHPVAEVAA